MNKTELEIKAAHIFITAANYIKTYGWQVKNMGRNYGPRCSMGALASAYPKTKWEPALARLMYDQLKKQLHGITLTDYNFVNNNPDKVIELYIRTAKSLLAS